VLDRLKLAHQRVARGDVGACEPFILEAEAVNAKLEAVAKALEAMELIQRNRSWFEKGVSVYFKKTTVTGVETTSDVVAMGHTPIIFLTFFTFIYSSTTTTGTPPASTHTTS
jgi:hypothetical protein